MDLFCCRKNKSPSQEGGFRGWVTQKVVEAEGHTTTILKATKASRRKPL